MRRPDRPVVEGGREVLAVPSMIALREDFRVAASSIGSGNPLIKTPRDAKLSDEAEEVRMPMGGR